MHRRETFDPIGSLPSTEAIRQRIMEAEALTQRLRKLLEVAERLQETMRSKDLSCGTISPQSTGASTSGVTGPLLVNKPQAAQLLGVSLRTLSYYLERGIVPSIRIGRRRMFSVEQLQNWVRELAAAQLKAAGAM